MSASELPVQVVWFKRDLRLHDHAALAAAAARGPLLPLYVVEPALLAAPDASCGQWRFIRAGLLELREALARLGQPLIVRVGDVIDVLQQLRATVPFTTIWAHEESGHPQTFARDRAVRRWARAAAVALHELPQFGVVRGLRNRDAWDGRWEAFMAQPAAAVPTHLQPLPTALPLGELPTEDELHRQFGLRDEGLQQMQRGGEAAGLRVLDDFLQRRGGTYHRTLSSPLTAVRGCSRLSPHLAWGTVSLRFVVQQLRRRRAALQFEAQPAGWPPAMAAFESRLHWHCHFIQKLEDQPQLALRNLVPAFDGLREPHADAERVAAWAAGETGQPLVDACMRSLRATGWLNFRMRCLLVSYLSYDLWQHWDVGGQILARRFVDYEPGIHYAQLQMQSGTAGNSVLRIYNPLKQAQDNDPQGTFIRRWVPELADVPASFLHAPWLMPEQLQHAVGCRIGRTYPAPLVDHATAYRHARQAISALRADETTRAQIAQVRQRHGSRRREPTRQRRSTAPRAQLGLQWDDDA